MWGQKRSSVLLRMSLRWCAAVQAEMSAKHSKMHVAAWGLEEDRAQRASIEASLEGLGILTCLLYLGHEKVCMSWLNLLSCHERSQNSEKMKYTFHSGPNSNAYILNVRNIGEFHWSSQLWGTPKIVDIPFTHQNKIKMWHIISLLWHIVKLLVSVTQWVLCVILLCSTWGHYTLNITVT